MNEILGFLYKFMQNSEYLILMSLVFLTVTLGSFGLYYFFFQKKFFKGRLMRFVPGEQSSKSSNTSALVDDNKSSTVQKISKPIAGAILPQNEKERKEGRLKMVRAGFRSKNAYRNFMLIRFFCAIIFPLTFLFSTFFYKLSFDGLIIGLLISLMAFYLPSLILKLVTLDRQQEILRALPDALDLMVVCAESGLGLDMTFKKVGEEIRSLSKSLSDEYQLTIMEIRAGIPRNDCFRNMFLRSDVQEINSLMTILNQASRFGTSISKALRVHADSMRTKRRQIAEEKAAKVAVKLIFPLILFIFPALMIVIGGPAFLSIYKVLFPTLSGGG